MDIGNVTGFYKKLSDLGKIFHKLQFNFFVFFWIKPVENQKCGV